MDTTALHDATEETAACLSEVTIGDLAWLAHGGFDLDRLCQALLECRAQVAAAVGQTHVIRRGEREGTSTSERFLSGRVDLHGGGLELEFRRAAREMEAVFTHWDARRTTSLVRWKGRSVSVPQLYEIQVREMREHAKTLTGLLER